MRDKRYDRGHYKKLAITAAIELMYGHEVVKRIREAETDEEIRIILHTARTYDKQRGARS